MRPKFGVTSWDLDPHPIWEETIERSLDLAAELDVVICPEIHAPTPIKHPVTQGYIDFIERTGTEHFKLLIDTGIFQTAPIEEVSEEIEAGTARRSRRTCGRSAVPMSDLVEVLPYVHFIQAKFVEIDDDLHDLHVPWGQIVPTLLDERLVRLPVQRVRGSARALPRPRPGPPPARADPLAPVGRGIAACRSIPTSRPGSRSSTA